MRNGTSPPAGTTEDSPPPSALRIAATALLVGLGYYVGANVGFVLRFPPATPSVLWPPNAILTATLLLTPPRRWWIYLLAALPAHLAAELGTGWPAALVLALFITNCSEALVAAICIHRFSEAPARVDTLRRVAVFLGGAVFLAPFVSSFADAAAVAVLRGEPYWLVWRTRFFANALTALTLVPAIVTVSTAGPAWIRAAGLRRHLEAAVLGVGLLATGIVVFTEPVENPGSIEGWPGTPLAFVLPFILLAAVRFGPGGASLSLLTTALVAIWAATHGRGPFTAPLPAESVLSLQIFLSAAAIPLMCLAALIEERHQAQEALAERLRFEELLSRLSAAFVPLPSPEMDHVFGTWLRQLGAALGLDRITLFRFSRDGQELVVAHSWSAPGIEPVRVVMSRDFPWMVQRILGEERIVFARRADLPAEAARDQESLRERGIRSGFWIPLVAGGRVFGSLAFVMLTAERAWSDALVQRLRLVAEVFANTLARQEAEEALRNSESMKSAILSSLISDVAVLDRGGRIIAVNEGWTQHARERGVTSEAVGVGANYLDVYRDRARSGAAEAIEVLAGIVAVLNRSSRSRSTSAPSPRS
jgi:integral membrane sensor domain MASE1/PAS domain-containing protein